MNFDLICFERTTTNRETNLKIEFLKNFIKLNEYKNFSKLAEYLEISQSTLSHQISQIEKDLGEIKLINRTTRKFELTAAGKIYLDYAKKIIELYESCQQELARYKEDKLEEALIEITASTLPGSHILPKFIAKFRFENQNVDFNIIINNSKKSIELLMNSEADFAGIGSFMNFKEQSFDYIKIGEDRIVFVCSPNHPLLKNNRDTISFDELIKYPFISREQGSGTRNTIEGQFQKFQELKTGLEMNDNESIISAVTESEYISILSEIIALKAVGAGLIKILNIVEYPIIAKRDLFLIRNKGKKLSKLKQKFWDYFET